MGDEQFEAKAGRGVLFQLNLFCNHLLLQRKRKILKFNNSKLSESHHLMVLVAFFYQQDFHSGINDKNKTSAAKVTKIKSIVALRLKDSYPTSYLKILEL